MGNTNWYGGNPVVVNAPSDVCRPLGWHETRNGRRPIPAQVDPEPGVEETVAVHEPERLKAWAADPVEVRPYVRIDVSAERLGSAVRIAADVIGRRRLFADIDTGYSVYLGNVEQRLSVTLFDVSLVAAFGFFAALRRDLIGADYDVDCGRIYFVVDGTETSHCAKRVAPGLITRLAGLSLTLETEGNAYGSTEVYASGPATSVDRGSD